jgi:hypothetical protein
MQSQRSKASQNILSQKSISNQPNNIHSNTYGKKNNSI